MIKVCIINRNFPPFPGATGYHAHQLAEHLLSTGKYNISVVTLGDRSYLEQPIQVHALKPNYTGRNKLLRLGGTAREGYRLIKKAKRLDADFYIIMTDPPLLNYWAAKLLSAQNWVLWTMDLYPQGFVAGGLAQKDDLKTRHYINVLKSSLPNLIISLGIKQRNHITDIYPTSVPTIVLPIGLRDEINTAVNVQPFWNTPSKITLAYVGNLSEAHDPDLISNIADIMDADKMHLVVSCYGAHAEHVKKSLSNLKHVTILTEISEHDMSFIDVNIVSLISAWTHVCVPSKAISSLHHGVPILFLGDEESDSAMVAKSAGWALNDYAQIKTWLSIINQEEIESKRVKTKAVVHALEAQLHSGWVRIDEFLRNNTRTDTGKR